MTPEFSRLVRIDEVGDAARTIAIAADPAEREMLAQRFALVSIGRLEAQAEVRRSGKTLFVEGRLQADIVQTCVATAEPLPATLDVPFVLRFVPEDSIETAEEIELSEADCDTLAYAGGAIDLGEAAAETLALSLDPFPRSAHADDALKAAGVVDETEVGPFAALKALKDRMGK